MFSSYVGSAMRFRALIEQDAVVCIRDIDNVLSLRDLFHVLRFLRVDNDDVLVQRWRAPCYCCAFFFSFWFI